MDKAARLSRDVRLDQMKKKPNAWLMAVAGIGLSLFAWFASWFVEECYYRTPHLFWKGIPEISFLLGAILGLIGLCLRKPEQLGARAGAKMLCGASIVLGLYGCVALAPPPCTPPRPHSTKTRERPRCISTLHLIKFGKEGVLEARGGESNAPITMQAVIACLQPADSNFPHCLAGGIYTVNPPGSNPVCSVHGDMLRKWK
jgi:hypothetical protein